MKTCFLAILVVAMAQLSALAQDSGVVDWSSKSGEYTTRATFVSLKSGDVTLRKPDGEILEISLSELTPEHADRARQLATETQPQPLPQPEAQSQSQPEAQPQPETSTTPSIFDVNSEFAQTDRDLIQTKLDSIETPGKTSMWPFVGWFYAGIAQTENKRVDTSSGEAEVIREQNEDGAYVFDQSVFLSLPVPESAKQDFVGPLLYLIGGVGGLLAFIWMLVVMFRESAWWGCTYLIPCINFFVLLIFVIKFWYVARWPFLLGLVFGVMTICPPFLVPEWAPDFALLEAALRK